jgi:transposase
MVGLIREQDYPALRALVARLPEAQLVEYCSEWVRERGVVVSIKTMSRMLVRLGLRRKKDRRGSGA